jgi:integrase
MPLDSNKSRVDYNAADTRQRFPTLADALQQVEAWTDLSERKRACMCSALKVLERLARMPAALVAMDPAVIGPLLQGTSGAACGISPSSLGAYRALIRTAMRRMGLIDTRAPRDLIDPAWARLRCALPEENYCLRLHDFIGVCDGNGIAPDAVDEAALLAYTRTLRDRRLTRSPGGARAKVVQAWNRAVETVPGWPQKRLVNPVTRQRRMIAQRDWPAAFAADVQRFVDAASVPRQDGPFSREAAGPVLSPATIRGRLAGIRAAVTAHVALGHPLETLVSLDELVEPDPMAAILRYWHVEYGEQVTGTLKQIGDTLRCIARYRFPADGEVVAEARRLARMATPPKTRSLAPRTEDRLMQFVVDPRRVDALLQLPKVLFEDAAALKQAGQPQRAAWMAAAATAIAIELRCPLRIHTLTHLRIGEDLVRVEGDRARWSEFVVGADITKTATPYRWPIAASLSVLIDRYITEYRPLGPHADTPWLFPARDKPNVPRAENAFSATISDIIFRYVGVDMNVHLFRAFAGMLLLEQNPDALDDLRRLLGHATLDTALRYYAFRQRLHAAARIDAALDRRTIESAGSGRHVLDAWRPTRRGRTS